MTPNTKIIDIAPERLPIGDRIVAATGALNLMAVQVAHVKLVLSASGIQEKMEADSEHFKKRFENDQKWLESFAGRLHDLCEEMADFMNNQDMHNSLTLPLYNAYFNMIHGDEPNASINQP